jgi:hypothetical protein
LEAAFRRRPGRDRQHDAREPAATDHHRRGPPEFRGTLPGLAFEIWVPLVMAPQLNTMPEWMLRDRHTRNLRGLARPKPGVTMQQANAEVAALARNWPRSTPT